MSDRVELEGEIVEADDGGWAALDARVELELASPVERAVRRGFVLAGADGSRVRVETPGARLSGALRRAEKTGRWDRIAGDPELAGLDLRGLRSDARVTLRLEGLRVGDRCRVEAERAPPGPDAGYRDDGRTPVFRASALEGLEWAAPAPRETPRRGRALRPAADTGLALGLLASAALVVASFLPAPWTSGPLEGLLRGGWLAVGLLGLWGLPARFVGHPHLAPGRPVLYHVPQLRPLTRRDEPSYQEAREGPVLAAALILFLILSAPFAGALAAGYEPAFASVGRLTLGVVVAFVTAGVLTLGVRRRFAPHHRALGTLAAAGRGASLDAALGREVEITERQSGAGKTRHTVAEMTERLRFPEAVSLRLDDGAPRRVPLAGALWADLRWRWIDGDGEGSVAVGAEGPAAALVAGLPEEGQTPLPGQVLLLTMAPEADPRAAARRLRARAALLWAPVPIGLAYGLARAALSL
jgi:hypothetical protein